MVNWASGVIIPVLKFVFVLFFFGWLGFVVYWATKKLFRGVEYWFRYDLFRKKPNEKIIQWCMEAVEKGLTDRDARKKLLLSGKFSEDDVNEIIYLLRKTRKILKGGANDGSGIEINNRQAELPKIDTEEGKKA